MEHYFEELQNLPPRVCYVKHKIQGGIIPIMTDEVLPPYQEFGYDAEDYRALLDECRFGIRYLLERRGLKERKAPEEGEEESGRKTKNDKNLRRDHSLFNAG